MNIIKEEDIIKYLGEIEEEHEIRPYHDGSKMYTIQCLKCESYILVESELNGAITNIVQHCTCRFSKNHNSPILRHFRRKVLAKNQE